MHAAFSLATQPLSVISFPLSVSFDNCKEVPILSILERKEGRLRACCHTCRKGRLQFQTFHLSSSRKVYRQNEEGAGTPGANQWLQVRCMCVHSTQEALAEAASVFYRRHTKDSQETELTHSSNSLGLKFKRNHHPRHCLAPCY